MLAPNVRAEFLWREQARKESIGNYAEHGPADSPPGAQALPESKRRLSDEPLKRPQQRSPVGLR